MPGLLSQNKEGTEVKHVGSHYQLVTGGAARGQKVGVDLCRCPGHDHLMSVSGGFMFIQSECARMGGKSSDHSEATTRAQGSLASLSQT